MKKNYLLFLLCFACGISNAETAPFQVLWQEAGELYAAGSYEEAAMRYEQIAAEKPEQAAVYFNLANTYYKLNRIGSAVLNYERALFFEPGYRQAEENLELTLSRIPNRIQQTEDIFFIQWWKQATSANMATLWAVLALGLFLALLILLLLRRTGRVVLFSRPLLTSVAALCLLCILLAAVAAGRTVRHNRAVVMVPDILFHLDGSHTGRSIPLPEGTVVIIEEKVADSVSVRLPDGRSGKLQLQFLEII